MGFFRFTLASLAYRWRIHAAVALGVLTATAVLTGALVVGDSVHGSLRHLALDRLGRIDAALVVPRFFRTALAEEVSAYRDPAQSNVRIVARPAIMLQATLSHGENQYRRIAGQVTVLGCSDDFWTTFGDPSASWQPAHRPGAGEIVLNVSLADKLGAKVGDNIILRLPGVGDIPAESGLGRKIDTLRTLPALHVVSVIPAEGLGRFGIRPTQQIPYDAFVAIETLQHGLDQEGLANAILASIERGNKRPADADDAALLNTELTPTLADYGLSITKTDAGYFNFSTERMLLEEPVEKAAETAFGPLDGQPTLTYLANLIIASSGKKTAKIPYSTVTALDLRTGPPLGPFKTPDGKTIQLLPDNEILLNSWVADDMAKQGVKLQPGDTIRLQYFNPESLHGQEHEETTSLKLAGIVKLAGAAADRHLVPELKGVTDQKSIANWKPPFKFDASIVRTRPPNNQDELYWQKYRATPKAFVSLATGRRLWRNRFGQTTSWRIPARDGMTVESLTKALDLNPADLGFKFLTVRQMALLAANGTTEFNQLFLAFSFFIIAAAVMLVALLFKLGIEGRADEIGLLLAVGFRRRRVARLLLGEGLVVSLIGGALGVAGGLGYAWLMLVGLPTWWLAAVVTPFLRLDATPESLLTGFLIGVLVSLATIAWSLRQLRRATVRRLMSGEATAPADFARAKKRRWRRIRWACWIGWTCLIGAVAMVILLGHQTDSETQAGVFFSSGALVLIGALLLVWSRFHADHRRALVTVGRGALARLAIRNGARNPLRSTLTIGLMAAASFVIVSVSAFRLAPPAQGPTRDSGDGGFAFVAESDSPIYQNLNTPEGRDELGFDEAAEKLLAGADIVSFRVKSGDDASCLNLYQPLQPRILGVPPALVERGGFVWSATAASTDAEKKDPWKLLNENAGETRSGEAKTDARDFYRASVPIVLDEATALYSLHLAGIGSRLKLTAGDNREFDGHVVGLLQNSIFQGDVLMSEANLLHYFPDVSGYRYFLVDTKQQPPAEVRAALEPVLGDYGFDAESTAAKLASFMAVQNTYLSTFQSLGGLGLLLGTIGLAVVQLRSVLERRAELALMRVAGFRRRRLAAMVLWENASLLIGGLGIGLVAALVSIIPQLAAGGATIPWPWLAGTLALVLLIGLLAGLAAVRVTLRAPLIPALRGS